MKLYQRIAAEIIFLTIGILGFDLLVNNYLFFHVIVELFSIVIMFVLFAITWNARTFLDNWYLVFVGLAAGFIAVLDLLHTLTYKGMNIIHSPIFMANQFWISTRLFESIVILSGLIFLALKVRISIVNLLILYGSITVSIILSITYFKIFPTCYVEGIGQTPFKIGSEYVVISILTLSLILLIRKRQSFENDTFILICTSIVLTIISEFCFTLYLSNYDYINKVGHIFKVLSFFMIYKANIQNGFKKPFETFFREIKENEEKIRNANHELKKQIATKNKFFSIISHDLRNPFTVITGFSDLLLKNPTQYNEKERTKFIKAIYTTSANTFGLLENLLSWSRAQTNTIPFDPLKFDIKEALDEGILYIHDNLSMKEIEIKGKYTTEWVFADIEMIKLVIRNLLSNAVKFTPKLGTVTIQTSRMNGFVKIEIIDSGVGIPVAQQQMLFQIDKTFSTKGTDNETGSGLGLILCAEFIAKNKGEINVESEVGKGSKFSFTVQMA